MKDWQKIEEAMNNFSFNAKKTAQEMSVRMHKTLQQSFTKLCFAWIKELATNEGLYFDDRNAASVKACKELYAVGKEVIDNASFPFI